MNIRFIRLLVLAVLCSLLPLAPRVALSQSADPGPAPSPFTKTAPPQPAEPKTEQKPEPAPQPAVPPGGLLRSAAPTAAERAARPAVARQEEAVRTLELRLAGQITRLAAITGEAGRLARERAVMEDEIASLTEHLKGIMPQLWAMNIRLHGVMDATVAPWDETDRTFTWLSAVYNRAREEIARLRVKDNELAANVAAEARLRPEAQAQAALVEKTKDALLAERLRLAAELAQARRRDASGPPPLETVLELAAATDFAPAAVLDKPLEAGAGLFPWPAKGVKAAEYDPQADPPRNGLGLATLKDAPVTAIHWGRVVYAGPVKGMGQAVVVAHGGGAMSVYAHLGRLAVKPGQEVGRGEMLGNAGDYPEAHGPGMSFELRFGVKPINPGRWLLAG